MPLRIILFLFFQTRWKVTASVASWSAPCAALCAALWVAWPAMAAPVVVSAFAPDNASDIVVVQGDILTSADPAARSLTVGDDALVWPMGIIPYTIDSSLSDRSTGVVLDAIDLWNQVGNISLLPLSEAQGYFTAPIKDSVRFVIGEFCASWVGRKGGQQDLWVSPNCPVGSVIHEIGHALGLEHEHTRPDRDQYIEIHWDNIIEDKRHNFETASDSAKLPGEYDYDSIMHYGPYNFSANGKVTITALDGSTRKLGQRVAPSAGDLEAIDDVYGSDLSVTTQLVDTVEGADIDIYISNLTQQGVHDIQVDIGMSIAEVPVDSLTDGWLCTGRASGGLLCGLPGLAGSAIERLSLEVSLPFDDSAGTVISVTSKTRDLDLSNNTSQTALDDGAQVPQPTAVSSQQLIASDNSTVPIQEDAVAHVAVGGGGSAGYFLVSGLLLLLLKRQTGLGVYRYGLSFLGEHGRYLHRGQISI